MNNKLAEARKNQYQPLLEEIKEHLPVTQIEYIKAYDIALFGADYLVFNQYYLGAINEYIHFIGAHRNRPWAKEIEHEDALYLFFNQAISDEYNNDVDLYLHELRDKLVHLSEMIEDEANISILSDEIREDANELEKNLNRFIEETQKGSSSAKSKLQIKSEKIFIDIVKAFLHNGNIVIEYCDLSNNNEITKLKISITRCVFYRASKDNGLESFGSAGETSFTSFAKLKYEIYRLNELIKETIDYYNYQSCGFKWSMKSILRALSLVDEETYKKIDR